MLNVELSWTPIIYRDLKGISRLFDRFFNFESESKIGFIENSENSYSSNNFNYKYERVIAVLTIILQINLFYIQEKK